MVNLALLPKKENISKKAKRLNEISDAWLKKNITTYTGIDADKFDAFSDAANFNKMSDLRSELFLQAFSTNRNSMLIN